VGVSWNGDRDIHGYPKMDCLWFIIEKFLLKCFFWSTTISGTPHVIILFAYFTIWEIYWEYVLTCVIPNGTLRDIQVMMWAG
jgi:hypothetical protein